MKRIAEEYFIGAHTIVTQTSTYNDANVIHESRLAV